MPSRSDTYRLADSYASDSSRCQRLAVELVRALRGRWSRAELSRRAGYSSNMVQRWESASSWPTASRFLRLHASLRPKRQSWLERFFKTQPSWATELDVTSPAAVAAFLRQLRGNVPIVRLAGALGRNRYTVSRWLEGTAEPKLPDFLQYVSAASRRLVDLAAALEDPLRLPSIRQEWTQLELARTAAYQLPWSHGVLRALELKDAPRGISAQRAWLARQLKISVEQVQDALQVLEASGQVVRRRSTYALTRNVIAVSTNDNPDLARQLKTMWLETTLERMKAGDDGRYGYSLFAISRPDLARIHELHLQFVRMIQQVIADSEPSECVALYASQLVNLGGEFPLRTS